MSFALPTPPPPPQPPARQYSSRDYSAFTPEQYQALLAPYQSSQRVDTARRELGLSSSQAPYLGLLAAANQDDDPSRLSETERSYAMELARRAKSAGDPNFKDADLSQVERAVQALGNRGTRGFFQPGEEEVRAGAFLTRSGLNSFSYGEYAKNQPSQASPYEQALKSYYEDTVKGYKTLYDTELSRQSEQASQAQNQANQWQQRYSTETSALQGQLSQAKTQADEASAAAERYRDEATSYQLDRLRRGVTSGGSGGNGGVDQLAAGIAAGHVAATAARPRVDTRVEVDATDSVLSRKGPVVETLSNGSGRAMARARSAAVLQRPVSSSYYSRRFG